MGSRYLATPTVVAFLPFALALRAARRPFPDAPLFRLSQNGAERVHVIGEGGEFDASVDTVLEGENGVGRAVP